MFRGMAWSGIHAVQTLLLAIGKCSFVIVPRRAPTTGLLGQRIIVVKPDALNTHQRSGDLGDARTEDELPKYFIRQPHHLTTAKI